MWQRSAALDLPSTQGIEGFIRAQSLGRRHKIHLSYIFFVYKYRGGRETNAISYTRGCHEADMSRRPRASGSCLGVLCVTPTSSFIHGDQRRFELGRKILSITRTHAHTLTFPAAGPPLAARLSKKSVLSCHLDSGGTNLRGPA